MCTRHGILLSVCAQSIQKGVHLVAKCYIGKDCRRNILGWNRREKCVDFPDVFCLLFEPIEEVDKCDLLVSWLFQVGEGKACIHVA